MTESKQAFFDKIRAAIEDASLNLASGQPSGLALQAHLGTALAACRCVMDIESMEQRADFSA